MKTYVRILLGILCAALVLAMPFVLSAPNLLGEAKWQLLEEMEGEETGWLDFLLPAAHAEVIEEESPYALPVDFTPGYTPNSACYTEDGYEDASIRVQMETRVENGVTYRIAWVEIASPTQLRTAIAGKVKENNKGQVSFPTAVAKVKAIAASNNAVVAINGDYYADNPAKTTFEYRMGLMVRDNTNQTKDMLLIDDQGDFHIVLAQEKNAQRAALDSLLDEYNILNAFTFGPALVKDGELLKTSKEYGYDPNGYTARTAFGQLDKLSYVMVIAEGVQKPEKGVTHQQMANFMYSLGCRDAFNLDGGGSSAMYFGYLGTAKYYNVLMGGDRDMSDIIYFATAVPTEEWEH